MRTTKDAAQRIIGNGNKIKAAIKELENRLKQIPRDALSKWRRYVDQIKSGQILDNIRAQQLLFTLKQIPVRTTKDATQRIIGNGNKIKAAIKELENRLKQIPRDALSKWRRYIDQIKSGEILDNIRAQQLLLKLKQIPIRVTKDASQRIIGNGNKIKAAIKELENRLKQIPRDALSKWRKYIDQIKSGEILDNIRAQQLLLKLKQIPIRVTKDASQRIIGNGNKIKGALKDLDYRLKQIPRDALGKWRKYL